MVNRLQPLIFLFFPYDLYYFECELTVFIAWRSSLRLRYKAKQDGDNKTKYVYALMADLDLKLCSQSAELMQNRRDEDCFYSLSYLNSNKLRLLAEGLSLLVIFFLLSL